MARCSSGLPVHPGSENRRSLRDGSTWERPTAMRPSSPSSWPPRPATSRGLTASAAARRKPEPPGFTRRSMPMAASVSSRSSGAAASGAAGLVGSLSGLIIRRAEGGGRVLPLVARHEARAGRRSAGTGSDRRRLLPKLAGVCKNPQVDMDGPAVAEVMACVAATVSRQVAAVSENVYEVILREIPELHDDKAVLTLLASSVDSNVGTCLQIVQHQIDLSAVHAPAAALEYARRLAQRGRPLTALLRAYRLGHTCFSDWLLKELARQTKDAEMLTAATLGMSEIVAGYIDQTSEEIVAAYTRERENWLRNRSTARAARIRDLLSGGRVNVRATEATLGYGLRQYHVGVVCWSGDAVAAADNITRLEHAISHVAGKAACPDPVFLPRDVSSAWAWLPLGIRDTFDAAGASTAGVDGDIHVAFGDAAKGAPGFRLTHRQGRPARAVALAAGPAPRAVTFGEVAPVAMMLGSADLLRA